MCNHILLKKSLATLRRIVQDLVVEDVSTIYIFLVSYCIENEKSKVCFVKYNQENLGVKLKFLQKLVDNKKLILMSKIWIFVFIWMIDFYTWFEFS